MRIIYILSALDYLIVFSKCILVQLIYTNLCFYFTIFSPIQFLVSRIYFWYSILFIMFRSLLTLFMAAHIHDNAKKPLTFLRAIPTKYWNIEVSFYIKSFIIIIIFFVLIAVAAFFRSNYFRNNGLVRKEIFLSN